jgi:hypothetical protein
MEAILPGLDSTERAVYLGLFWRAYGQRESWCEISHETLAAACGVRRKTGKATLKALAAFGKAVGVSSADPAADPIPGALAYSAYVAWLALYGSAAEFAGAFLVNLEAWGANCGRLSQALQDRYGLTKQDVAFFDLFATPPPGFEDRGLAVVDEGLAGGVDPAGIRRAARLLQGYELLYWDTMLQATQG